MAYLWSSVVLFNIVTGAGSNWITGTEGSIEWEVVQRSDFMEQGGVWTVNELSVIFYGKY
jgi:hypothetical protein